MARPDGRGFCRSDLGSGVEDSSRLAEANAWQMRSRTLSRITGAEVFLKFANLQFTAAFKERGALNKLLSLTPAE